MSYAAVSRALKCADAGEQALFLQAALLSQGHFSPQLPKHAEICAMVRAAEKHLRPKKMKLGQTLRELSSKGLLCLCFMPKALEEVISTLGQERLALALRDLSRKEGYGHSPGIWLGIFKGFPILLFFSSAHSIFLVAKWEEKWGGGRGVENGGGLAKRKRRVYFLLSKGGAGKEWAPHGGNQLRKCLL